MTRFQRIVLSSKPIRVGPMLTLPNLSRRRRKRPATDGTLGCELTKVEIDTAHGSVNAAGGRGTAANMVRPIRSPSGTRDRITPAVRPSLRLRVAMATPTSHGSSPGGQHTAGCNG